MVANSTLPFVRDDALPEGTRFDVTGCAVNPVPYGCLSCPRAVCVYDEPDGHNRRRIEDRDGRREQAIELLALGLPVREIADRIGISRRVVYRYLGGGG